MNWPSGIGSSKTFVLLWSHLAIPPALMTRLCYLLSAALACLGTVAAQEPTAQVLNGTYRGRHLSEWDQDAFLGVPFAQPPVGQLRYRWPKSLNSSFDGVRDATEQGYSCMQFRGNFNMSEDCLTLNVVRPAGKFDKPLPVLVWIFGGGLYTGSVVSPTSLSPVPLSLPLTACD